MVPPAFACSCAPRTTTSSSSKWSITAARRSWSTAIASCCSPRPVRARAHVDSGVDTVDWVPPGGHHAVNVRFDLGDLRTGERVAISLAGAVTLDGQPLSVPNLEFVAD
jgi:hypothetical protein